MEILLGFIILGLIAYIAYKDQLNDKERDRLMRAVMAKNLQDYKDSEIINKKEDETPKLPEEIDLSQIDADDNIFRKHIKNTNEGLQDEEEDING